MENKPAEKPEKKAFALRLSAEVFEALSKWADDDLRSLNAQIEFVLREALRKQGRVKSVDTTNANSTIHSGRETP
jgi:hypothetical protein